MYEKTNATQAEVNKAVSGLKAAYAGLQKVSVADKSVLKDFYEDCLKFYKQSDYSVENWKEYQTVLKEVKAVLDNPNATQADVDRALKKLINITAKLNAELDDPSTAPKNPITDKDNVMDKDDKEDVKTGYIEKPVVWGIAGMSSILVAMFVAMKKKRVK